MGLSVSGPVQPEQHLGLLGFAAGRVLSRVAGRGLAIRGDDLRQVGWAALARAARHYDPARGAWSSFALLQVRAALWRFVDQETRAQGRLVSIDEPLGDREDDLTLEDVLPDERVEPTWKAISRAEAAFEVRRVLTETLLPSEHAVLTARYGIGVDGRTAAEIAAARGVSHQRVCQLEQAALVRLRSDPQARRRLARVAGATAGEARDGRSKVDGSR